MIVESLMIIAILALFAVLLSIADEGRETARLESVREQKAFNTDSGQSMILEDGQWIPLESPATARTLNHPFRLDLKGGGCEMVDCSIDNEGARR